MGSRFTIDSEIRRIYRGFTGYQREVGQTVLWYRFDAEDTAVHPVYDEAYAGGGRLYFDPVEVPALAAIHLEGYKPMQGQSSGFYTTDRLNLVVSLDHMVKAGLPRMTEEAIKLDRSLAKDRIVFNNVVFSPSYVRISGTIEDHDVVIGIMADEVDPDELVNDPQFQAYAS